MDDEDDLESLLEMPLELPQKAERKPKPMQWPLLPERGTTRADMRPLAPLTRFADDRAWAHRTLSCSVTKGILKIEENGHRLSNIELFWSRVSSGKPSSSTREAYHLDMNEMVLLVRPSVRCRQFQTQEQWSFACRRSWLPYILHHLATEGAVLEKEVELCFNLEGRCGKGGYGTIRRGCPVVSEYYSPCQVAIKVAAERDVRHELRMLVSAGRHPSVIQQHGAFRGSDQGRGPWSLILEFYPEGDLWHFCADRLPLPQALSLLHNLLLGLQHIHSRKIFHRDVKPENILVSCERAVLCDFGVAELLELRTLQRARGLTPQYASPEMVTSNSMDPRGDVYAAGATFHFMITLQYVSTSIKKKWSRWWSKPESELCFEKPPLAQLPVCCQDLLLQMICPERKRLTAKEAVRHYAFWSLADPEDYGEASSHAHSYLFPAGDLSQTPSDVAPLSIFGTESVSAWRERVVAPGANGASGTSSEASSRRSGRRSSHTSASTDSGWQNNACQQVIEEQISVDESMEILKQKLRFPPEQSSSWGRETKKPRPPGVKAPRARRTSVSHWIGQHMQALAEHLPRRPSNLSKVEPEPAELPVIPAELQREAQHPF